MARPNRNLDQALPPRPARQRRGASCNSRGSFQSLSSSSLVSMSSAPQRAANDRLVRDFLKQPTRYSRRAFLRTASAAAVGIGVVAAAPVEAMGIATRGALAVPAVSHAPSVVTINATVASSANNLDFRTLILAAGWNGTSKVTATVTINSGVYVGSSSTGLPAFTVQGSFPSGSTLNLINNGHISGAGGKGGNTYTAGGAGGQALNVSSISGVTPIRVTNNGYIWGGGGGGGGNSSRAAGGGGGGTVVGVGGTGYSAGYNGHPGTATVGGNGGGGGDADSRCIGGGHSHSGSSGAYIHSSTSGLGMCVGGGGGGGPGYKGGSAIKNGGGAVAGGSPGNYIVGNSNVTWVVTGTRIGGVS